MGVIMSGYWDRLGEADFNDRGNYFLPGQYVVQISRIFTKEGFRGHSLIFNFEVVESSCEDIRPGSMRDWVIKLDGPNAKFGMGDLKAFLFALFGKNKDDRSFDATCAPLM